MKTIFMFGSMAVFEHGLMAVGLRYLGRRAWQPRVGAYMHGGGKAHIQPLAPVCRLDSGNLFGG